jgi:nitrogen fixation-related uncharacterized protein
MDLSVYLVTATIVTFAVGAAFALWYSIADGQWNHLDRAALVVLDDDDPMPVAKREVR